ncbi:Phage tail fiber protein [plant metagenome]|uniref:Phage tail fiber protein n=1 Tax=plant metagenome TaxID=1297885 RepID=A0A484QR79_9ZZZZ
MSYYGLLTPIGAAKEANAKALGIPILLTHMAVCHGNGADLTPPQLVNGLIGEWRRAPLNQLSIDPQNPAYLVAEQIIPETVGGQYIRGLGLYDSDGDLFYVANCPPTYKPQLSEGSARTQVIRMVMAVGSPANFELRIDPSVVLAPRSYVDAGLARKLDKDGTAVAAVKMETARRIGISGGVTASAKMFDGRADLDLKVTDIDVSKATAGVLPFARGGTGLAEIAAGEVLMGAPGNELVRRTMPQLLNDLGGMATEVEARALSSTTRLMSPATTLEAIRTASSVVVFTADGEFPVPDHVNEVFITGTGAGGGGGAYNGSNGGASGGGSGACCWRVRVAVTPGSVVPVHVGVGGARGTNHNQSGFAGGTTSFGSLLSLGGGGGGITVSDGGLGGNYAGPQSGIAQNGQRGEQYNPLSLSSAQGGQGGSTMFGDGGQGGGLGSGNGAGRAAHGYGAGGGGGASAGGGPGVGGFLMVEY